MPLPAPGTPWPPPRHATIHQAIGTWSAWYEGDRDALARVYGGQGGAALGPNIQDHVSQFRGGIVGTVARWFWGQPQSPEQASPKLHIPLAADIASTSANLLFGEPPAITVDDAATQARLEDLLDEHWWDQIVNAAELCAGLGGVYLRGGWDEDVAEEPLASVICPDAAAPVGRWGRLAEVTFGWVLQQDEKTTVRHLEHHAPGRVEHGLYLGDDDTLGRLIPLTEHPDTEHLATAVNEDSAVETGLDRLDVVYVPNKPNRSWRNDPVGRGLGQPDVAGVEPILDAIDETYTSLMRDVRLSKARAVVARSWLEPIGGRGGGARFNLDQELFAGVEMLPGQGGSMPIEVIQPDIRDEALVRSALALVERAISGAGYSLQTFGLAGEVAMTAAESYARERKTHHTRGGKIRRWRPALQDLVEIILGIDAEVFKTTGVKPLRPTIEFQPVARDNPEALARTTQMLYAADAASTETRVRMNHPDWDDGKVSREVTAIDAVRGVVPDPDTGMIPEPPQQ